MSHTLRLIHDGSIQIKSAATDVILCNSGGIFLIATMKTHIDNF